MPCCVFPSSPIPGHHCLAPAMRPKEAHEQGRGSNCERNTGKIGLAHGFTSPEEQPWRPAALHPRFARTRSEQGLELGTGVFLPSDWWMWVTSVFLGELWSSAAREFSSLPSPCPAGHGLVSGQDKSESRGVNLDASQTILGFHDPKASVPNIIRGTGAASP
ncbi:hypothetical protein DUI87_28088 [Hirundo rustica rustica]|uniref:Uncharacterized protein n=1 Tax=Hirundo rustica rustica TaxID=333673 RepID=A0A3M0J3T3_HIRRU|nr:hypothetical protein DUI87_28088 [Hirundo rustica rustica]